MNRYFKDTVILTLFAAVFMSLVAVVCLLIAHWLGAFGWVIIISFFAAAVCPLLATLGLLRFTRVALSLFDLIACAAVSLVVVALFNVAFRSGIHEISGRHLSRLASRGLWFDILGWVMGLITLARFVSGLPEKK
jgi:hypothetical protein